MANFENLGQKFVHIAQKYPKNKAIITSEEKVITYGELQSRVLEYSHFLKSRNVKNCDVIGILNDKDSDTYALMLASLLMGAVYVNLDPKAPKVRQKKILDASNAVIVFGSSGTLKENIWINEEFKGDVYDLKSEYQLKSTKDISEIFLQPEQPILSTDPAYLMFTSGSTGTPKGAVMTHGNVSNFLDWSIKKFSITSNDNLSNVNPMFFDNSVFDFYTGLFSGACLLSVNADLSRRPRDMVKFLTKHSCTIWFSVPSMLVYIHTLRAFGPGSFNMLRWLVFGGEGFPKDSLRKIVRLFPSNTGIMNVYGPTECTCICSSYEVRNSDLENDELLPLGSLIDGFKFLIRPLDKSKGLDSFGELLLGGSNVGLGYFNDYERSSQSFIQNPNHELYRDIYYCTGDLVEFDSVSGNLIFKGRADNQIKRMGFRIELEEIDTVAASINGVTSCAAVWLPEREGRSSCLLLYASCDGLKESDIGNELKDRLPYYMQPDEIVLLDKMPLNSNGKVDRKFLKENSR